MEPGTRNQDTQVHVHVYSLHILLIETGRYYGIQREERICQYCDCYIEDEFDVRIVYITRYNKKHPTLENIYC